MDTSKPIKFTIQFKLYPEDIAYVLRMPTEEDHKGNGRPHIDTCALLELYEGMTFGDPKREVREGVEPFPNEPDYNAYSQFCEKIQAIHDKIMSANSPLHVLTMATGE